MSRAVKELIHFIVIILILLPPRELFAKDEIPFENRFGLIIVKVSINGGPLERFIVDTGAGPVVLDLEKAIELGLMTKEEADAPSVGKIYGLYLTDRRVEFLQVGNQTLWEIKPMILDMAFLKDRLGEDISGILGQDFLKRFIVSIDYQNEKLVIFDRTDSFGAPSSTPIPFKIRGDDKILVPGRILASQEEYFILDTGASITTIFRSTFKRLGMDLRRWKGSKGLSINSMVGSDIAEMKLLPLLQIGPHQVQELEIAVTESLLQFATSLQTGYRVAGFLGYSFLKEFKVTIDYRKNILYLEPSQ